MPEYIEREAFKNNLMTAMINKTADGDALAMMLGMLMCDLADCEPAADVAPVVHGEWIYHEMVSTFDGMISGYSCSGCCTFVSEEMFDSDEFPKDICGFCGAVMDGGKK